MTGCSVTYSGADSGAQVTISNSVISNVKSSGLLTTVSPDAPTLQKVYKVFDAVATVDMELEINKRLRFNFNVKATPVDWANPAEAFPFEMSKIASDYGVQKTNVMPSIRSPQVKQCQLEVFGSKQFNTNTTDLPTPFTGTVKNFCFTKISAPNLIGYSWEVFHNSCQSGVDLTRELTEVTLSILEDDLTAPLQPDTQKEAGGMLTQFYTLGLWLGNVKGKDLYLSFSKLQCVDAKVSEIGARRARDVMFKNCGTITLIYRAE